MQIDNAYGLYASIHAVFGRTAPAKSSLVFGTLQDNTADIPDECRDYIYSKAQELDNLPQNLTKFFRTCWDMWRNDNPGRVFRENWPECGGTGGQVFFRRFTKKDGIKWVPCFAPCPLCTWIPDRNKATVRPLCYTKKELQEKAFTDPTYVLLPDSYKGDVCKFRLDMDMDPLPPNPYFPSWLEGFRQRFREGKAAMDKEREKNGF